MKAENFSAALENIRVCQFVYYILFFIVSSRVQWKTDYTFHYGSLFTDLDRAPAHLRIFKFFRVRISVNKISDIIDYEDLRDGQRLDTNHPKNSCLFRRKNKQNYV